MRMADRPIIDVMSISAEGFDVAWFPPVGPKRAQATNAYVRRMSTGGDPPVRELGGCARPASGSIERHEGLHAQGDRGGIVGDVVGFSPVAEAGKYYEVKYQSQAKYTADGCVRESGQLQGLLGALPEPRDRGAVPRGLREPSGFHHSLVQYESQAKL